MSSTKNKRFGSVVSFAISAAIVVAALFLYINKQFVVDQFSVWSYEPTSQITNIVDRTGLTGKGKFLLYAAHPQVESAEAFNQKCPRQEQGSPILGCYTSSDRIYIFDVTNEKLSGMQEVTAIHEMLHAAWWRLDESERNSLSSELRSEYKRLKNPDLEKRVAYYERSEPGEVMNELHSILGTEFSGLSDSLESYYGKLFDRSVVLGLHGSYSSVYNDLYSRADSISNEMKSLESDIGSRTKAYEAELSKYTADVDLFNQRARSQGFTSQQQFNSERSALVKRANSLELSRESINKSIILYNNLSKEYNDISAQIDGLNKSIDSIKQLDNPPSA